MCTQKKVIVDLTHKKIYAGPIICSFKMLNLSYLLKEDLPEVTQKLANKLKFHKNLLHPENNFTIDFIVYINTGVLFKEIRESVGHLKAENSKNLYVAFVVDNKNGNFETIKANYSNNHQYYPLTWEFYRITYDEISDKNIDEASSDIMDNIESFSLPDENLSRRLQDNYFNSIPYLKLM
ncbi:MAG: hypothetical protein KGY50_05270 [Candidatus Thermoplasmatota archaeon]|nr:hypothetical protein [Candidatus Thermoplasmatota archaeon]